MAVLSRLFGCCFPSSRASKSAPDHNREPSIHTENPSVSRPVYMEKLKEERSESFEFQSCCARQRLELELKEIDANPPTHISFGPVDYNDLFYWEGIIYGPVDTPYEGGLFHLSIRFPLDYPFNPPSVQFITKVFHPYIDKNGKIDIDILQDQWNPALTTEKLILSLSSFLFHPDPDDDENEIARLYRHDRNSYNDKARRWTLMYAMS